MIKRKTYLLVLFIGTFFHYSFSKSYTFSGFIYDKSTNEPLIGATILENQSEKGCVSNSMGYFSLVLDSGECHVVISYIGYGIQVFKMNISDNIFQLLYFERDLVLLDTVNLNLKQNTLSKNVQSGKIDLPIHQIQSIPSILGESDPLKISQMLPGVQSGGEATPGLFVRGSSSDQNLILIDDAPVYNPFHLFGIFSIVNSDALKTFEIIKGGYSSEYGGRLASVVNMNLKEGNKKKVSGDLSLGMASSKVLLEVPLIKEKVSMIISGRSSYAHLFVKPFLPKDQFGSYYFYDFTTKFSAELNSKTKLYFSGMYSGDRFYLTDESVKYSLYYARVKWNNSASSLRLNHVVNSRLFYNAVVAFSSYNLLSHVEQKNSLANYYLQYQTNIRDLSVKNDFTYYINSKHHLKFGGIITQKNFRPDVVSSKNEEISSLEKVIKEYSTIEGAVYIDDEFKLGKKIYGRFGVRLNSYTYQNLTVLNPEPRVSFAYQFKKSWAIKMTYTQMHQYLHLLTTKGVGLPTDLWVPATAKVPFKMAKQYTFALEKYMPKSISISLEFYYKDIYNDISLKEGSSFMKSKNINIVEKNDLNWEDNIITGTSWNYGAELFVHKQKGRIQGWVGYTLAWSKSRFPEMNFGKVFYNRQDRRHSLSLMLIYQINEKWTMSASWVYLTGNPITLANSVYNYTEQGPQNLETFIGYLWGGYEYSGINNYRMPSYHRMDFGISYKIVRKKRLDELEFSVYNLYNRQNPYFYYIVASGANNNVITNTAKQVSVLPVLPSINYKIRF